MLYKSAMVSQVSPQERERGGGVPSGIKVIALVQLIIGPSSLGSRGIVVFSFIPHSSVNRVRLQQS